MSNILMAAFDQWCKRPADERFDSLDSFEAAVKSHRAHALESTGVNLSKCRAEVSQESDGTTTPVLRGTTGRLARFSHWSFGQVSRLIGAPASYLRGLPAPLAVECINDGLQNLASDPASGTAPDSEDALTPYNATLLLSRGEPATPGSNGQDSAVTTLRAVTSSKYARIWNVDVVKRLRALTELGGFQPAPAGFDGCRGLYASEADMFAFFVDNDRRIFESLPGGGLSRGFFVSNSEVGAGSFVLTTFLYEWVCGNHRVIGASNVKELRLRHVGTADSRAHAEMAVELRAYAESSAAEDEAKITRARAHIFGATKDEVLDAVFGLRVPGLSRRLIGASYDRAVEREDRYGNPATAWALAGGMTEVAQAESTAAARVEVDRMAARVMQVAF